MPPGALPCGVAVRGGTAADASMTDETGRYDRVAQHLTRRRALASGAALVTAGGTLVWVADPAQAAVSIDSFAAQDQTFTREQVAPVVEATLAYDYDAGNSVVSGLRFRLGVDGTTVAEDVLTTDRTTLTGETTLSGTVTDSDAWAADDFAPAVAESVQRTVGVSVEFAVLDDSESVIVEDTASDTASLTVHHPQESRYVAAVGGTATFSAADN